MVSIYKFTQTYGNKKAGYYTCFNFLKEPSKNTFYMKVKIE